MTDTASWRNGDDRDRGEEQEDLATLKKLGVIDAAGAACSLCQQETGDCRPTPITVMAWVPATCNDCYRWLKDRALFDEQRDKDLFYPDDELIADGGRPEHEVERRMPTLQLIENDDLRERIVELTTEAPEYFWEVPASTSGYHHPLCRGDHGLWIHTLMLSTVIDRLADSYVEQGLLEEEDIDYAHAAAILHDQRKNGPPSSPSTSSVSDHEILMADEISSAGLSRKIVGAVESHMGPWYDGPAPESELARLVHDADMISSTSTITPAIQEPIPEELTRYDIETVDLR